MSVPALPVLEPGSVWLVGAGPGDPGLLTLMAQHALQRAEIVVHDALVPRAILALAAPGARLESVGKRAGRPSAVQLRIHERLIRHARDGKRVVRLKGGDPFVFGRGGEEALALRAAGIPFRVVPGVSAGTAAPALAGIPVTHRGTARSVAFVTGHGMGGGAPRDVDWAALARGAETLVLFMAATQIEAVAAALVEGGRSPDDPVALLAGMGTPGQQRILTVLADATHAARTLQRTLPVLIVIGPVVELADVIGMAPSSDLVPALFPMAL